jgi:hypothetical protein
MPPAAPPTLIRRALAAATLVGALVLGVGSVAGAQEVPPATTVPGGSILVPGTTVATTAPPATSEAPAEEEADEDDGDGNSFFDTDFDANEKVWIIVGALVAVAILMLVLTVIYWRHTRPDGAIKQDRRIDKAERREEKAARKDEKRRRKAADRDPFTQDDGAHDSTTDEPPAGDAPSASRHPEGPMDLDGILGRPEASRSVFGEPPEDSDPSR